MKTSAQLSESPVPFGRVANFVRQLTHDVRNGLSAIDLEAAFVAELVNDAETSEEVRKLRNMVANTARMLRDMSQNFQPVRLHCMPWEGATFFEELRGRLLKEFPGENGLEMEPRLGAQRVSIDLEQMVNAVVHVLRNAFQFRREGTPVRFSAFVEGENLVLELREPKESLETQVPPEKWGEEPLQTARQGGYGLGLFRARQILESHGGALETKYRDNMLITRMLLPVYPE